MSSSKSSNDKDQEWSIGNIIGVVVVFIFIIFVAWFFWHKFLGSHIKKMQQQSSHIKYIPPQEIHH